MIAFKYWYCDCGNKGWAVDSLNKTICNLCGKEIETRTTIDKSKLSANDIFTLRLLDNAKKKKTSA